MKADTLLEARIIARWYEHRCSALVHRSPYWQSLTDAQLKRALTTKLGMSSTGAEAYLHNLVDVYRQKGWI